MLKKKKNLLVVLVGLVAVAVIGGVIAYSQDRSILSNELVLPEYKTVFAESFSAPTNWTTCETVEKTVTVKNEAGGPVAVRIKIDESWENSLGETLPLVSATSRLRMAQINEAQNSGWTRYGDYFYYNSDLEAGSTTTSPITGVTLNCNANLGAGADDVYSNAQYRLKITAQTIQADAKDSVFPRLYDTIAGKVNDGDYQIDFTRKAMVSNDTYTANGNGVNAYTENGKTVYYYRGQISDNNVLWANRCWLIVRTTFTDGIKMIYKGNAGNSVIDGVARKTCNSVGGYASAVFNDRYDDLSSVGYMYGETLKVLQGYAPSDRTYVLSNDVSRDGNAYTLDVSDGQSVTGTWAAIRQNSSSMRYFCTDGSAQCDGSKIGYMTGYWWSSENYWYVGIGGYDNIESALEATRSNTKSSDVKLAVDSWFVNNDLDGHRAGSRNYEDDLEDAIFCNDRSFVTGAMSGKDYLVGQNEGSKYGALYRNFRLNDSGNYEPSLDCNNKSDAFTVTETENTNGKLDHKVALITMDELTLSGGAAGDSYLRYGNNYVWTMSPAAMGNGDSTIFVVYSVADGKSPYYSFYIRPVVSLKAGTYFIDGDGTTLKPYIVP